MRNRGALAGLAMGAAFGGWYGAAAGILIGAMLDGAARGRRERPDGTTADRIRPDPDELAHARAVLGVGPDASGPALKRACREVTKRCHPDGREPDAERFMAARKAYETLLVTPEGARSGRRAT